ncbi:MAG: DUF892 family protein [Ferruginibacter sp.]
MAKTTTKKNNSKTFPATKTVQKKAPGESNSQFGTDADTSVEDFFISELKDTYWAENHLIKSLPKMIAAAASKELKKSLQDHLEVTREHASRLENIFDMLEKKIVAKKCDAMEGLTMGGEHVIENTIAGTPTRDMGIIMSALKVENFEITTYQGLIKVANSLSKAEIAKLLQQTLDEEMEASQLLSDMS